MTTKLANLLAQRQALTEAAQRQAETEAAQRLAALRDKAHATLLANLGEYANDLLACVFRKEEFFQLDVLFIEWHLGSHELQLACTTITWSSLYTNSLAFKISEGQRYVELNTNHALVDILFAMRQAYPSYQAYIAQETQRQAANEAAKRQDLINILSFSANWGANIPQAQIAERYHQLVTLGEEQLADQRLAQYRADVETVRQRQEAAATRKAAYETALAEYEQQMAAYNDACRQWAETEQARLWQPWTLWRVRYCPFHDTTIVEEGHPYPIETVYTLDTPEDIIANLKPVAHVEMVDTFGGVTEEFTIATFLDAKPIRFTICPPIDEGRAHHHRTRFAGDYAVNIPPFILDEPAPAPIRPNAPSKNVDGDQW